MLKKRGETFYRFEDSDYASGVYFDQYVDKEEQDVSSIVLKALGNIPIITKKMWQTLKEEVMQYGLFHSYRLAIAPTGY